MPLTLYHKPTCSKSRETKKLLDDSGVSYEVIQYIDTPPTLGELRHLSTILDGGVEAMLRPKEAKELGWKGSDDSDEALRFLAEHPEALQRPIVTDGERAVIGRPTENVKKLL